MIKCKTCSKAIFDALWADYKCSVNERYIYEDITECKNYKKGTPKESKRNADYEANLHDS